MATLAEIGRAAGVSSATVSAVLNPNRQTSRVSPAVAQRIRALAASLGYAPNHAARSLRRGCADAIAVTIATADAPVLENAYHSTLLAGIEAVIRMAGSEVVLVGPHMVDGRLGASANERTRDGLRARRYDAAIVLCGPVLGLDEPGLPVVAIEQTSASHMPVVLWDEELALQLLLLHLADFGHRRLLWLGPTGGAERGGRCAQAAWSRGLSIEDCRFAPAGDVIATAREALGRRLQRARDWSGVVCFNDRIAIGAQQALQAAGLSIPGDVSVVGIDDIEAGLASPALTTVNHRLRDMGRRAGELALALAAGRPPAERLHVVAPELVVRASSGPVVARPVDG